MIRRVQHFGFTLLELILVMVVLTVVLGIASPSLRGWSRASGLRDAADELAAFTRYARSQAVTTCKTHRLSVSPDGGYYLMVLEDKEFVPVGSSLGQPVRLPDGYRVELIPALQSQQSSQADSIDFFPSGRTQPATLRVIVEQGDSVESVEVACASPAEPFEVVARGEGN